MKQTLKTFLAALSLTTVMLTQQVQARGLDGKIPSNFETLGGAFKGVDEETGRTAYLLIYPKIERGAPSGIFDVYMLIDNKTRGQVFRGEIGGEVGTRKIVLYPIGVDAAGESIVAKSAHLHNLEVRNARKYGTYLYLSPDGIRPNAGSYIFNRISDDVTINSEIPNGEYRAGDDSVNSALSTVGAASMITKLKSLGLNGKFNALFEMTGIMVLRPEVTDPNTAETYGQEKLGLVMVHVNINSRAHIVAGPPAVDGRAVSVKMLKKR